MQSRNETSEEQEPLIQKLHKLLNANQDKRVVVVGTTCTGKSTFLKSIRNAHDMDELIFPQLTPEEADYVNSTPWTKEIGRTMDRLARGRVSVQKGEPVFGTIVFDSDLIINLKISDELLRERVKSRGVNFEDAKNMQRQIDEDVEKSGIPVIDFPVG